MNYNKKSVKDIEVAGKRVLCRCDFNVPMKNGVITFPKPQNCPLHKTLGNMEMKKFGEEYDNFIGLKEFGEVE